MKTSPTRTQRSHKSPDTRHGVILYVEDVNLSFDGFKALNDLNLYINMINASPA